MPLSPSVGSSAHPCKEYFKTNSVLLLMLSCTLPHPTAPVRTLLSVCALQFIMCSRETIALC